MRVSYLISILFNMVFGVVAGMAIIGLPLEAMVGAFAGDSPNTPAITPYSFIILPMVYVVVYLISLICCWGIAKTPRQTFLYSLLPIMPILFFGVFIILLSIFWH